MIETLTDGQLAKKLASLRKAIEDREVAKGLLRDSELVIKHLRTELKPYERLFVNPAEPGTPKKRRKPPTPRGRINRVDYPGIAKIVEQAGGHISVQQFMRLVGATRAAANARLQKAREKGLLTATQIGRKIIFHSVESLNHAAG